MIKVTLLAVTIVSMSSCTSASKVRFHHQDYGVVDGKHIPLRVDSNDCLYDYLDQAESDQTQTEFHSQADEAYSHGDPQLGLAMDAVALGIEGYHLSQQQSRCMTSKGWSKLDNNQ